jgi:hypothetical protein
MSSGGLGGLNPSPNGVVIGVVQLQLPKVVTKDDLTKQTEKIVSMVGKARRNLSGRVVGLLLPGMALDWLRGPYWLASIGVTDDTPG